MNDRQIVLLIQEMLNATEWNADTLDEIALILQANGYPIRDLGTPQSNVIVLGPQPDNDK